MCRWWIQTPAKTRNLLPSSQIRVTGKAAARSMFFLPISDDNPTRRRPWISYIILGLCLCVFYWQISLGAAQQAAIFGYGMVPARLFGAPLDASIPNPVSGWTTLFTSMFMHGGLMHLGGNMLYLWIFSDNVEDSIGRGRFIIFYLLCGVCAAFAQALTCLLYTSDAADES